jgi:hypothetical protein
MHYKETITGTSNLHLKYEDRSSYLYLEVTFGFHNENSFSIGFDSCVNKKCITEELKQKCNTILKDTDIGTRFDISIVPNLYNSLLLIEEEIYKEMQKQIDSSETFDLPF